MISSGRLSSAMRLAVRSRSTLSAIVLISRPSEHERKEQREHAQTGGHKARRGGKESREKRVIRVGGRVRCDPGRGGARNASLSARTLGG